MCFVHRDTPPILNILFVNTGCVYLKGMDGCITGTGLKDATSIE